LWHEMSCAKLSSPSDIGLLRTEYILLMSTKMVYRANGNCYAVLPLPHMHACLCLLLIAVLAPPGMCLSGRGSSTCELQPEGQVDI
jgi:hypothetical protein